MKKLGRRYNEVWLIDENDAKRLLSKNYEKNRKLRAANVRAIARDMKDGNFKETPFPLIVTENGILLNGQHRLNAVIESHAVVPFEVRVVPDDSIFLYIDNGLSRKTVDYIESKHRKEVTSIGAFTFCAINGKETLHSTITGNLTAEGHGVYSRPTRSEIVTHIEEHLSEFEEISKKGIQMYNAVGCGSKKAFCLAIWLIQTLNDDEAIEDFVEDFIKPASTDPIIIAGKSTIQKAYTSKTRPTFDWLLGTTLMMYEYYFMGKKSGSMNKSAKYFRVYDEKLQEWRKNQRESS